jgi:hypothetical protein
MFVDLFLHFIIFIDKKYCINLKYFFFFNLVTKGGLDDRNRQLISSDSGTTVSHALEPGEDDGIDDSLSYRHIAAARYHRNHRLINELFNEYVVPDTRSLVTDQRMQLLKQQVESLGKHQEKLKDEVQSIEEKHEAKKKKIADSSIEFQKDFKKVKSIINVIKMKLNIFFLFSFLKTRLTIVKSQKNKINHFLINITNYFKKRRILIRYFYLFIRLNHLKTYYQYLCFSLI